MLRQPGARQLPAVGFAVLAAAVTVVARRISSLVPGVLLAVAGAIAVSALAGSSGPTVGRLPANLPDSAVDLPWSRAPTLLVGSS